MKAAGPAQLPATNEWWLLPSGRIVSIRRIEGAGFETELVVRYVDEHGSMGQGEFNLSISYVVRGRRVSHD